MHTNKELKKIPFPSELMVVPDVLRRLLLRGMTGGGSGLVCPSGVGEREALNVAVLLIGTGGGTLAVYM